MKHNADTSKNNGGKYLNMKHSADDSQRILSILVLLVETEPNSQTKFESYQLTTTLNWYGALRAHTCNPVTKLIKKFKVFT